MAGVNSATLVGRMVRDPELTKTTTGLSVVRFTIAVDREKKDDDADFIKCKAWRQQADYLSDYAVKGSLVSVVGKIRTGSYDDKDGRKIFTTEVEADRVSILDSRKPKADYPYNGISVKTKDIQSEPPATEQGADELPF